MESLAVQLREMADRLADVGPAGLPSVAWVAADLGEAVALACALRAGPDRPGYLAAADAFAACRDGLDALDRAGPQPAAPPAPTPVIAGEHGGQLPVVDGPLAELGGLLAELGGLLGGRLAGAATTPSSPGWRWQAAAAAAGSATAALGRAGRR